MCHTHSWPQHSLLFGKSWTRWFLGTIGATSNYNHVWVRTIHLDSLNHDNHHGSNLVPRGKSPDLIQNSKHVWLQGSNFSARGLKSAPERSNLIIFEISVNLVKKYFAWGGRGKNGLESVVKEFFGIITGNFLRRNCKSFLKFSLKRSNFRRCCALLKVGVLNPKMAHHISRSLPNLSGVSSI